MIVVLLTVLGRKQTGVIIVTIEVVVVVVEGGRREVCWG